MIAKTLLTLFIAFAIGQTYFFLGPNINWFPFGYEPIFPSIEYIITYGTIFGTAFLTVTIIFSLIYRKGYKDGKQSFIQQ